MPNLRGPELLLIVLLVVLLFGAKRLPDAARSIGRSLRIFKAETKGLVDGEVAQEASAPSAPPAPPAALDGPTGTVGGSGLGSATSPSSQVTPPTQA